MRNRFAIVPETQNFDKFVTIDWISQGDSPPTGLESDRRLLDAGFKGLLWDKTRNLATLTCIGIVIGCIAGFIQIFTEALGNWKTGHCARNWLLNKSFCCVMQESSKRDAIFLSKREELECIEQGLWVNWSGGPLPFLIFTILSVGFALCSCALVKYVAPNATGSGISEIKVWVSGFKYTDSFLSLLTLVVKSVALPLAISSGLSIGKEGPSVHYAACCGYVVANLLLKKTATFSQQAEYLIAASGAGVAVAFGAPIGGVLFGLEEIASSTEFKASVLWKSFYVALSAVTTLKYINPFRNGMIVLFNVTYDKYWTMQEIPIFILLGIFGGLYGKYVTRWNIRYVHFRRHYLSKFPVQEILILTSVTALISYFNEFLKLDMTESMGILFHECTTNDNSSIFAHRLCAIDADTHVVSFLNIIFSLLFATLVRILLVIISYGAMVPAGIFVPSMAVGATFGRAISLLLERYISGSGVITPGTYAFLGAAAALSGITNLTITVVVIMFELTGAFIYIIPTMIVVATTKMVLDFASVSGGIADQMIVVNGFPLLEYEEDEKFIAENTTQEVMATELVCLSENMYASELRELVYGSEESTYAGYPIVPDEDRFSSGKHCIGYVLKAQLYQKLLTLQEENEDVLISFTESNANSESFRDIVNRFPLTTDPRVPVSLVFRMFKQLGCKTIIVEKDGILQGLVTRKDILRFVRLKHRDVHGPVYIYNDAMDAKVWKMLEGIISRFGKG